MVHISGGGGGGVVVGWWWGGGGGFGVLGDRHDFRGIRKFEHHVICGIGKESNSTVWFTNVYYQVGGRIMTSICIALFFC